MLLCFLFLLFLLLRELSVASSQREDLETPRTLIHCCATVANPRRWPRAEAAKPRKAQHKTEEVIERTNKLQEMSEIE